MLAVEVGFALRALRERRLVLLLVVFAALLLLAAQAPLAYRVDVGVEDGPGSDLPLVAGFHPRERDLQGTFRWTRDVSQIRLPGVGVRPLLLTLRFIAVSPEVAERGPRELELWANGVRAARLLVRPQGAVYRLTLPPQATGDFLIELRSVTFVPSGDERSIGAGLAAFVADAPAGPALPAWRTTLLWLAAAVLAWLALRRIGFVARSAFWMLLPLVVLAAPAALLDPPRFAFGAVPAVIALGCGWLLGVVLSRAMPGIARRTARLGGVIPVAHWRWLMLFAVLVLATRYGGKIYPDSMPGDIGFHANRLADVARGTVLIVSRNRGVDFPYPPALYLVLMPFLLAGGSARDALQLGGALLDALSPVLVYVVAACVVGTRGEEEKRRRGDQTLLFSAPLLAAALYCFSAAGYMVTWWNFSTHVFAQFAHLLLITALVIYWPLLKRQWRTDQDQNHTARVRRATDRVRRATDGVRSATEGVRRATDGVRSATEGVRSATDGVRSATEGGDTTRSRGQATAAVVASTRLMVLCLIVLQLLVYLGHFGFWMNMSLLGSFGLAALLVAAWRGMAQWSVFRALLLAFVVAQSAAVLLFYSGYTGLLLAQVEATATGGLTGLARREPIGRDVLWTILWNYGLRTHYGFVSLPLALCGGWVLARRSETGSGRSAALVLMAGTLVIALFFGALPFLTGSTLSSRWLMFSAWAVALGAALSAGWLWRRGVAGRLVVGAAAGYVFWITVAMWLTAMIWRVRPPEPF